MWRAFLPDKSDAFTAENGEGAWLMRVEPVVAAGGGGGGGGGGASGACWGEELPDE